MVKKRSIQQKAHDASKGALLTTFKEWIVNPLPNDFGFDFEIRLTKDIDDKNQEVSEISFYVQNKSSINSKTEKAVEDLSIDDWRLFLGQRIPVLITKYDISKKEFFWEIAQNYIWDTIEKKDQNWKRQKFKRITLTKKINNLEEMRKEIITSQKRITRYHSLNLGIGEGINLNKQEVSKISEISKKALTEYKFLSLHEAYLIRKSGDRQKAIKILSDVYNSPKNDKAKIIAIIGIIFELNPVDFSENNQIVSLANEAINLSGKLKIINLKEYAIILRNRAILFLISKKMSEIQLSLKIQKIQGDNLFSFFYTQEFKTLYNIHQKTINEINDSLVNLLVNKEIYYYLACLPILIDIFTSHFMRLAIFNKEIINEEKKMRKRFLDQCEFALENFMGTNLKMMLLQSLSYYYYWRLENKKAIDYLSTAINLGKEDKDIMFVKNNLSLLEKIKNKPNPYEIPEPKTIDDMTVGEYQKVTQDMLKAQGINLESEDDLSKSISIALRDMNPKEYFQHCELLHMDYLNTSRLGTNIGLPSMGSKLIWCKYCKHLSSGFDLKNLFQSFKQENCKSCSFHKPRSEKWNCYVKWVKEQAKQPEFRRILNNIKKNF